METIEQPFRAELFSIDQLQDCARQLAPAHRVAARNGPNRLLPRLSSNEAFLSAYNQQTLRAEKLRRITPAAEWLLDNFYLIEEQIRMVRRHLPRTFSRELPHLLNEHGGNYPRVYHLALELISHVDGRIDAPHLTGFIAAYQEVTPLKLGELWAIPIMLRIALIENLRRIAALLHADRAERDLADSWADRMQQVIEADPSELIVVVGELAKARVRLSQAFVTELWRRLQEHASSYKLALGWIEERLATQGLTIEQLVQSESQSQAANQVSVGNSITSLRFLDAMDWREFVETLSLVERTLRSDPAGIYPRMDFATRDGYRHVVERLAKQSGKAESEIAQTVIGLAAQVTENDSLRHRHVGYYLVDRGLKALEKATAARTSALRCPEELILPGYLGVILLFAAAVTYAQVRLLLDAGLRPGLVALAGLLTFGCASQLGLALLNWLTTRLVHPGILPRLDFSKAIDSDHSVMVVVPTLLTGPRAVENLLEGIEVRFLANRDDQTFFALLTDFPDAAQEQLPADAALLQQIGDGIKALNRKYRRENRCIFYLFHRPRLWNPQAQVWMGYERKRGKLGAFNALLRGHGREQFSVIVGDLATLPRIKYVITLDTDTQLPREAARQMVGTMAHPLNTPVHDPVTGCVVDGYAILQPRAAVSLPSATRSRFARLFSGDPGIDPYTRAVSDVYQDLFKEGSFIGKGIYDVDAFERALAQKFPENRILSHDLLEGSYARSGLVSDVILYEDFPARYLSDARRRHRWMRGDWQIASWLLPSVPGPEGHRVPNPIHGLSRWKIFDNLRRSLVPIAMVTLLALGWLAFPAYSSFAVALILAIIFLPGFLSIVNELLKVPEELPLRLHLTNVARSTLRHLGLAVHTLILLPYDAWLSLDAIVRTFARLTYSKRHLLEWQTASETERASGTGIGSYWRAMWFCPALASALIIALALVASPAWDLALPLLAMWACAPLLAWWISRPLPQKAPELSGEQKTFLRLTARKTWRYFETFVGPEDHWLPPDNFQEFPRPILATRTSPTNIGLAMLSTLAAWDFGYIPMRQVSERLRQTLDTLEKLEKYQGHFYNWYDTRTLEALHPRYLSTVDNGNLAGLLLTLRAGLLELAQNPLPTRATFAGLRDTLHGLLTVCQQHESTNGAALCPQLEAWDTKLTHAPVALTEAFPLLEELARFADQLPPRLHAEEDEEYTWWRTAFATQCRDQRDEFLNAFPWLQPMAAFAALANAQQADDQKLYSLWQSLGAFPSRAQIARQLAQIEAWQNSSPPSRQSAAELLKLLQAGFQAALDNANRQAQILEALAMSCDACARMDFTLLYVPARKLFSVGYNVTTHKLDSSYYDLLASEARLASYVAISLGQVSQEHWFALGRLVTSVHGEPALISWSGSMFEYLMPRLVMPAPEDTLLYGSAHSAVRRQIEYGEQLGVPWGVSESGYNLTDAASNYQYRAFGVPGLGFKRGLGEDVVIAPYATLMALMVAPQEACANLERLRHLGAEGRYGFYEALDYTPARVPRGKPFALVQSFMVHHQGMAFLSLAEHLLDGPMQRRFDANPFFKAAELLLHERVPKESSVLYPHELELERGPENKSAPEASYRVFTQPNTGAPEVHLLSNSRYHVMVTNAGGGYSLWNNIALTRWREDATRDCWGTFIYLREPATGKFWANAHQPTLQAAQHYEAIFSQGRAEFRSRTEDLDSHTEIAVSPEDDVEVRRITFTNHASTDREIEVTSFAEVVLNSAGADQAHPAFSKLFIQTEILRAKHAIVCSRRPRARGEQPPWMFHLMLVLGEESGDASYETDRSRFLGRGNEAVNPDAMNQPGALSNSDGSVLDPAIAIRRTVRIAAKSTARIILVTGAAATQAALLHLVDRYQDHSIAERSYELAWTHGLVTLRHLNATEPQAQLFGRLASALLFSQTQRRAAQNILKQNRRGQRNLWSFGISGDLPIVLVRSTHVDRLEFIREMLQAHAYWRLKGLAVDLVIVNDDDSIYRQSVHDQILTLIASGIEAQMLDKPGGIFVRRADQLSPEDQTLLQAAARIVLSDENGTLLEQLQRRPRPETIIPLLVPERMRRAEMPASALPERDLLFDNGVGGFAPDGREYVITLRPGQVTPAPWVNVIANPQFGTLVSESGGAYTWAENCHEFRLTPWNNDPITDLTGEAFYLRDEHTGSVWSPTPFPARGETPYVCRHGFGYTVFEHREEGIASELWIYVAADAPIKFARLILRNQSDRRRSLTVTGYWEWVLGELRHKSNQHVVTELEPTTGAILARNSYNTDFEGRVAFVAAAETLRSFTCDRAEFIGRNGTLANPAALQRQRFSGKTGAGLDACTALQVGVELQPGEEREVVFKFGVGQDHAKALALLQMYRRADACRDAIYMVRAHWNDALGAVQVETPDAALNVLANGWLLYQTLSCRLWARTGFYQSGGAFGFRDQLQDAMALIHSRPTLLREHLLRAAAHQFREGDVQHWWHPPHDRGVRTHFSDDYLWLPYATCRYVNALGDTGVLDERVTFLEGRPLKPEEESYYDTPRHSGEADTLYEHCVRAIKFGLKFGEHGLPLIGCGDWNDGMNLIGEHGKGESVWLAFFLCEVLEDFVQLAAKRGDSAFAVFCQDHVRQLRANIEKNAWDGQWYRRAYFDNGEPLGSASNEECQIDSLPQSWAVLSGSPHTDRAREAMEHVAQRLVKRQAGLIQLFDPPFDKSALEPGYIKGYVPGVRENGGQYTHGAIWTVMAFAEMGQVELAWDLFQIINPVRHSETAAGVARYKVEPYVIAADVYSLSPHTGRGGWSWYTGSAGWFYRLITESFLGLNLEVDKLQFTPRLPRDWKTFQLSYRYRETHYRISLTNTSGDWSGKPQLVLDGQPQATDVLQLMDDQRKHKVEITF